MERKERIVRAGVVAALLHVGAKTVARWSEEGRLPVYARTLGGHRLYDLNVIEPLVESLRGGKGKVPA